MPASTQRRNSGQRGSSGAGRPADDRKSTSKGKTSKVGNLTRDLELRFADNGTAYAHARLAVEDPVIPGDWSGERVTSFYDLTIFGEMAEHAAQSTEKGMRVVVIGRAELEEYTDTDGQRQTAKKILVDAIGPDLRWATAEVVKLTQGPGRQVNTTEGSYADEEPF